MEKIAFNEEGKFFLPPVHQPLEQNHPSVSAWFFCLGLMAPCSWPLGDTFPRIMIAYPPKDALNVHHPDRPHRPGRMGLPASPCHALPLLNQAWVGGSITALVGPGVVPTATRSLDWRMLTVRKNPTVANEV